MSRYATQRFKEVLTVFHMFVIFLIFLIRFSFKINNKVNDSFFVTTECSKPIKELAKKNTLVVHILLIYIKLLISKCMWVLGINLF